jgi:hypothetical protein
MSQKYRESETDEVDENQEDNKSEEREPTSDQEENVEKENDEKDEEESGEQGEQDGKKQKSRMKLKLGDIIQILAPTNELLHENTFFIEYIDENRVVIIDVASIEQIQLNREPETSIFTDRSIKEIVLISRSPESGYARQNNLVPGTWIEIHIGGDVSTIITGEITSLEEDQIEIRTVPELDVIYIDFEYKGIPEYIPIKKIIIRDKPALYDAVQPVEDSEQVSSTEPTMEYLETGEAIIRAEENADEEENVLDLLRVEVAKSKQVVFGEDLDDIEQFVELPESKRRYGLELQTGSLLDELLSTIPATKRTQQIMSKIHTLIARYRELRNTFSTFNENGDVSSYKRNNPQLHKPIIERIKSMDTKIDWVLPVVSLKKKIYRTTDEYEAEEEENIMGDTESFLFDKVLTDEEEVKKNTYYNDRTLVDESKYYKLYQQLADLVRPFEDPAEHPGFLEKAEVKTALETIVDNYDEFYSSVVKQESIVKRRYVIQKYDLGLNKRTLVKKGDREFIETSAITKPDKAFIKSVVTLPAPVVQWSRVRMPETSILEKSNLHMFPLMIFRLLKKNKEIAPFVIEDLAEEIRQKPGKKQTSKIAPKATEGETEQDRQPDEETEFLQDMRHYVLSDIQQRIEEDGKFEKFLQAIIPKTRTLIRLVRKYITQKLSFISVVQALEPFYIYSGDISYKQYLEIRAFIIVEIEKKKKNLDEQRKNFGSLVTHKFAVDPYVLSILRFLLERPELMDTFLTGYQLPDKELLQKSSTTAEIIKRLLDADNGVLLTTLIQNLMSALHMPKSLSELFEESPIDDMTQAEKVKARDCHKRVLTKKYTSIADLQKDNNKDIFYDKEYDDTPYELMKKYKDEQEKMSPEKFERFLVENLVQKHGASIELAPELAKQMIKGKKEVGEGEYAIFIDQPEIVDIPESLEERRKLKEDAQRHAKTTYYYRKGQVWIHERELDDEAFMDTKDLFCNVKKECLSIAVDPFVDKCMSTEEAEKRLEAINRKKIQGEFNQRFDLAAEDMKAVIQNKLVEHLKYLQRWIRIQSVQKERANNVAYQIGLEATKYTDAVVSPHLELRDRILGQSDFVKKQHDIVRLYDTFCREPMELLTEDVGWKYCKTSNTKLLPAFLYDLATTFVRGGDYQLKLEEICHTHGLMSDSGDAIVDKFSGFSVRAIDFAEEDGFDDAGFKITTHAFIQKGEVDKVVENILDLYSNKDEKQVCEDERAQMICNLLAGLAGQIGHPLAEIRDFCVRIISALCDKLIDTEEKYNREAKKAEENKGIKLPPYKTRSQQLTVLITATVLFMTIQTETPSFQTNKSMPGCVKSFKGYPLSGEEDLTGIHFMACVLSKMEKKIEPWNTISKLTVAMMQEQIKKIATVALKNAEVDDRYLKKREYIIASEPDEIPEEHSIGKWLHFLPPLVPISVSTDSVSPDFKDGLLSAMRKGQKGQHRDLLALRSKIGQLGFSLITDIQKIVKNKELLLVGASSGMPYLQNVCCNEKERVPILYFNEENSDVLRIVKAIKALSIFVKMTNDLSKPAILFDPRDRTLKYPPISGNVTEANIYSAFIHYCQLDKGAGLSGVVPAKFHAFLTDVPVGYNPRASLEEKIDFLKRHDKRFSLAQFTELLQIVSKENIIELEKPAVYNRSEVLKDLMLHFDEHTSPVIDKDLRENIYRVLTKYDKTKMMTLLEGDDNDKLPEPEKQKIAAMKTLKNGLADIIQGQFKPAVLGFFKKYGKTGKRDFDKLTEFINTFVTSWASSDPIGSLNAGIGKGGDLYKIANFIKNAVYEMTSVFPNILITNITNVSRVHAYWCLAQVDSIRIYNSISAYYQPLGEFREDRVLTRLLQFVQTKFVDLRLFFDNLPIHESIRVGSHDYFSFFDRETIELLLEYVFLSVLHEYIIATDEIDLIRLDSVEQKKANRQTISEGNDEDTQFSSEYPELAEEYQEVYGDMTEIQIQAGNREELKTRVAKMLLAFINITRKNKTEIDISYENISAAIRKRKEKEKNRIIERFKHMSEDERRVEDQKKKLKLDEWNVGTQKGIFEYDKATSTREVNEQMAEEALDIQKHGIRQADFVEIHGDNGLDEGEEPLREMLDVGQMPDEMEEQADEENVIAGLTSLKANFFDGQFYSDDESDDGFGAEES